MLQNIWGSNYNIFPIHINFITFIPSLLLICLDFSFTSMFLALANVAQWVELRPENWDCQFDSHSGHVPGLWARSPVGDVWETTDWWSMFSHTPIFPFLSPSFPPFLKINIFLKKKCVYMSHTHTHTPPIDVRQQIEVKTLQTVQ